MTWVERNYPVERSWLRLTPNRSRLEPEMWESSQWFWIHLMWREERLKQRGVPMSSMAHSTDYEQLLWYQTGMGLKPQLCSLLAVGPQTSSFMSLSLIFCNYETVICTTPAFLWELICLELLALCLAHGWSWRNQSYNCYWLIFPFMCLSSLSNPSLQRPVQISSGCCGLLTRKRQR